jgi:biopolymer transport protein ExbB
MRELWASAVDIWLSGGWAMIALAANALLMFWLGTNVYLNFKFMGVRTVPERRWRRWIAEPERRKGKVGQLLDFTMGAADLEELQVRFDELHATEVAPFDRDLRFMRRSVSASPLLGLLGTVTGMLATFQALASGAGGDETMDMIASGISEALITTQTGLLIALPGLFMQHFLSRQRERYQAFLAHVETVCTQHFHRMLKQGAAGAEAEDRDDEETTR